MNKIILCFTLLLLDFFLVTVTIGPIMGLLSKPSTGLNLIGFLDLAMIIASQIGLCLYILKNIIQ